MSKLQNDASFSSPTGFVVPERKGFLCILLGGFEGIRASKLTSEAAVGPRKASGVRHRCACGAPTGGASRDRSDISGLDSRPLIWGLSRGSSPNGSGIELTIVNGSEFTLAPNSSGSTEEEGGKESGERTGGAHHLSLFHFIPSIEVSVLLFQEPNDFPGYLWD